MSDPLARARAHVEVLALEAAAALLAAGFPSDLTRPPLPHERGTSFLAIDRERAAAEQRVISLALAGRRRTLDALLARLATAAAPLDVLRQLDELAAGIAALPELVGIVDETAAAVSAALVDAAEAGLSRWADDAARAGLPAPTLAELGQAQQVAAAQGRRVAADAAETAARALRGAAWSTARGERTADAYLADVIPAARQVGTRGLEDVARQAALAGYGAGRNAGIATTPSMAGRWYASELLDRNTCGPCSHVDGREYSDRDAALADYPDGRYVACEGGDRCRGTLVAVAAGEVAPSLPRPAPSSRRTPARRPVRVPVAAP